MRLFGVSVSLLVSLLLLLLAAGWWDAGGTVREQALVWLNIPFLFNFCVRCCRAIVLVDVDVGWADVLSLVSAAAAAAARY